MATYSEKLRDPRWQKLRLEVMDRDGFTCLRCRSKTKTLNVHHLVYHREPWDSPLAELETLCEECHEWRTKLNKAVELFPTAYIPQILVQSLALTPYADSVVASIIECVIKADSHQRLAKDESDYDRRYAHMKEADRWRGMAIRISADGFQPWEEGDK